MKQFLILRLGPEQGEESLREPFVKPFDITGKAMKGWVMIELEGIQDDQVLREWLQKTHAFVNKLPGKESGHSSRKNGIA